MCTHRGVWDFNISLNNGLAASYHVKKMMTQFTDAYMRDQAEVTFAS